MRLRLKCILKEGVNSLTIINALCCSNITIPFYFGYIKMNQRDSSPDSLAADAILQPAKQEFRRAA
jgi:hypothetical protein